MKKVLLVLAIGISMGASAQIKSLGQLPKYERVGIARQGPTITIAELSVSADTNYMISYFNNKYPSLNRYEIISFSASKEDIEALYLAFKNAFTSKDIREYDEVLTLSKDWMGIGGGKLLGLKHVTITGEKGRSLPMTENQVDKLFGKNK